MRNERLDHTCITRCGNQITNYDKLHEIKQQLESSTVMTTTIRLKGYRARYFTYTSQNIRTQCTKDVYIAKLEYNVR